MITITIPGWTLALILIAAIVILWTLLFTKVLMPLARPYLWRLVGGKGDPPDQANSER